MNFMSSVVLVIVGLGSKYRTSLFNALNLHEIFLYIDVKRFYLYHKRTNPAACNLNLLMIKKAIK